LRNIQNELFQQSTDRLEDLEWPLLDDNDSESECDDELSAQSTSIQLVQLQDAVEQFTKSLSHHPDQQQRKDRQNLNRKLLSKSEWNELDELILLLLPFAQSTKLIEGSQYPTLGMMLPTISLLSSYLHRTKISLTLSKILNVCQLIEDSISARWDSPLTEAYVAFYLDPDSKISRTEIDQFYDDEVSNPAVDNELERYKKVTQIN
ncbi:3_t:CDS:2, partial [Racocetra persica]